MTTHERFLSLSAALALSAGALGCGDDVTAPAPVTTDLPPAEAAAINQAVQAVARFDEGSTWSLREDARDSVGTSSSIDTTVDVITATEWVHERVTYSASANPDDFMMYNPQASVLWPGNLVQGNSLEGGVPNSVPIADRAPGRVTLAILSGDSSGAQNSFFRQIERLRFSDVQQAMNEILAGYKGGTPAKYSFTQEEVYSASQLQFSLAAAYSGPMVKLSGELGLNFSDSTSRVAVRLTQEFFSMVFDDPEGPSGVFGPTVTAAALAPYLGPGNPLCYISTVTYGRIYILVYESKASARDLRSALSFAYDGGVAGGTVDSEARFKQVMQQTSVKIIQIGGDPAAGLSAGTARNLDAIRDFLASGANFSSSNVGAPISYTVKYLGDASLVRMNNTMTYTVDQKRAVSSTSRPTESTFSLSVDQVEVLSTTDPNGGDGTLHVRLIRTDTLGETHALWEKSPNPPEWQSGWFGQDTWPSGATMSLGWNSGNRNVPNIANEKVSIEFTVGELDSEPKGWTSMTERVFFSYAGQGNWKSMNEGQSTRDVTVTVDDTTVRIRFKLTRNNIDF